MDLSLRTLNALDWGTLLERFVLCARSPRGARAVSEAPLSQRRAEVLRRYQEVDELIRLEEGGEHMPSGAVTDQGAAVARAARGAVLSAAELVAVGYALHALTELRRWVEDRNTRPGQEAAPSYLWRLAEAIDVDPELQQLLSDSFERSGELSARAWPELAGLRSRMSGLRDQIRRTLDELLADRQFAEILQDRYVTERDGRFVLPVKVGARRGLGIVHGTSASGETAFVEPAAVVELHNDLRETEAAVVREEKRILTLLSGQVGLRGPSLESSFESAAALDVVAARVGLGRLWRGVVPEVGDEGVLHLDAARHPLLELRGVAVVANDIRLGPDQPGLVLSGPNTGGKTVAMKTAGLLALLVQAGVPIPAEPGSRVDLFAPVVADVGDLQSVEGDLSTFSGHMTFIRDTLEALDAVATRPVPRGERRSTPLVLLDELAMGTDPAQGAALARAILEAVVDRGARVVATTHFAELKVLPLVDGRFAGAAVLYAEGRPTWRLAYGVPGSSHALSTARRLGLPLPLVTRAESLLEVGARALSDVMEELEAERARVAKREIELRNLVVDAERRGAALDERQLRLAERERALRQEVVGAWRQRLREREDEVRALVAELQAGPDLRRANTTLESIRATRHTEPLEVGAPVRSTEAGPALAPKLEVGARVRVRHLGQIGKVVAVRTASGGEIERVEVQVGAMRLWVEARSLEAAGRDDARRADRAREPAGPVHTPTPVAVRLEGNTCDLRGQRVEDALIEVEHFFDRMSRSGVLGVYLLHGHGTGALKGAIRQWLPGCRSVRRFRPALPDEGGDAYSYVELG